ncbi:hypothetical protein ACM66B_004042 [Microbotryomycetes sp. NB124-2]
MGASASAEQPPPVEEVDTLTAQLANNLFFIPMPLEPVDHTLLPHILHRFEVNSSSKSQILLDLKRSIRVLKPVNLNEGSVLFQWQCGNDHLQAWSEQREDRHKSSKVVSFQNVELGSSLCWVLLNFRSALEDSPRVLPPATTDEMVEMALTLKKSGIDPATSRECLLVALRPPKPARTVPQMWRSVRAASRLPPLVKLVSMELSYKDTALRSMSPDDTRRTYDVYKLVPVSPIPSSIELIVIGTRIAVLVHQVLAGDSPHLVILRAGNEPIQDKVIHDESDKALRALALPIGQLRGCKLVASFTTKKSLFRNDGVVKIAVLDKIIAPAVHQARREAKKRRTQSVSKGTPAEKTTADLPQVEKEWVDFGTSFEDGSASFHVRNASLCVDEGSFYVQSALQVDRALDAFKQESPKAAALRDAFAGALEEFCYLQAVDTIVLFTRTSNSDSGNSLLRQFAWLRSLCPSTLKVVHLELSGVSAAGVGMLKQILKDAKVTRAVVLLTSVDRMFRTVARETVQELGKFAREHEIFFVGTVWPASSF